MALDLAERHRILARSAFLSGALAVLALLGFTTTVAVPISVEGPFVEDTYSYDLSDPLADAGGQTVETAPSCSEQFARIDAEDVRFPALAVRCLAPNTVGSGVRGLANAGDELAQGGVYALRDSRDGSGGSYGS